MTSKNDYWIQDAEGVKALVSGTDARDEWVRVHGWSETSEPTGQEFQWIRNVDHGGKGVMNHEAVQLHEGLGWVPSGPDGYDDPDDDPAPAKSSASPKSATSGDKKE